MVSNKDKAPFELRDDVKEWFSVLNVVLAENRNCSETNRMERQIMAKTVTRHFEIFDALIASLMASNSTFFQGQDALVIVVSERRHLFIPTMGENGAGNNCLMSIWNCKVKSCAEHVNAMDTSSAWRAHPCNVPFHRNTNLMLERRPSNQMRKPISVGRIWFTDGTVDDIHTQEEIV